MGWGMKWWMTNWQGTDICQSITPELTLLATERWIEWEIVVFMFALGVMCSKQFFYAFLNIWNEWNRWRLYCKPSTYVRRGLTHFRVKSQRFNNWPTWGRSQNVRGWPIVEDFQANLFKSGMSPIPKKIWAKREAANEKEYLFIINNNVSRKE